MLGTEVGITKGLAGLGFTNDGTKTTLLGITGDYLRIGDADTTGHSLASKNDLEVTGKLEVDGNLFADLDSYFVSGQGVYVGATAIFAWSTGGLYFIDDMFIGPSNSDGTKLRFLSRDTGVGSVSVARLIGAADPYFEATLPMVLNPSATPGTLVEGHFWYGSSEDAVRYRDASASRYVAEDVLVASGTLTAGAQAAKIFAWQNTRVSGAIIVHKVVISITTPATAAATIDVGSAATDVTADNLIDGAAINAAASKNSVKDGGTNGLGARYVADDEYITGYEGNAAASTGLVGKYYIYYTPV